MFIVGPKFAVMSPEFKRWLKEPRECVLYDLAKEVGYTVKKQYVHGVDHMVFYSFLKPDGSYYHRGKTSRSRYIFDLLEATVILKRLGKKL